MIRKFAHSDVESVLTIWLEASIKAHNFVPADFWESKVKEMREVYLPAADNFVFEEENEILGFVSIYENILAAIFVLPKAQSKGIGSQLIKHAISEHKTLALSVYKSNNASIAFYKKHGFVVVSEQMDEHTGQPELTMKLES